MAAENNVIAKAQITKVREIDFSMLFSENVKNLIKMLGVTRKIPVTAGTALKVLKVTGTLQSGVVAEGDIIPLSQYQTSYETVAEATLNKWRKATTAEAIIKGGYDQAVNDTNKKMLLDIQKGIRTQFVTFLATGTATASGTGLQAALAAAWGKMQVLFEDDAVQAVYFVNPLDVADYIGSANITVQTAFGMNYVENFLGLGTVIMTGAISQGTFYATAKENLVCYYINVNEANGIGDAFDFTTDPETGFVGIHEDGNYTRMQEETVAVSGITFFAERLDGVIVGTIGNFNDTLVVKAEPAGGSLYDVPVNNMQSNVSFGNGKVTGTLKYLSGSNAITDVWGEGYFLCFNMADSTWTGYSSVKVGLTPSAGSGLVEITTDDTKNGICKVTDKAQQLFTIVSTKGGVTKTKAYSLADLVLETAGEG